MPLVFEAIWPADFSSLQAPESIEPDAGQSFSLATETGLPKTEAAVVHLRSWGHAWHQAQTTLACGWGKQTLLKCSQEAQDAQSYAC